VQKRPFKNNTLGWLGVVILDHAGKPTGVSIEPQGTIWLSEAEVLLTARAPRQPKDNPFEEQVFLVSDGLGGQVRQKMRPLVPIEDARWVPQMDRYTPPIPGDAPKAVSTAAAAVAATSPEPSHASGSGDPVAEASAKILAPQHDQMIPATQPQPAVPALSEDQIPGSSPAGPQGTPQPPNTPPGGQGVPPGGEVTPDGENATSWTEPPNGQLRATGTLAGENPPDEPDVQGRTTVPSESAGTAENAGSPSEQSTVVASTGEETASQQPIVAEGEETGAAVPPSGEPVEGEFASHEEVGDPGAAQQSQ
jgi:hypothetical protein